MMLKIYDIFSLIGRENLNRFRKRPITFSLIKILKSNKIVLVSEELVNKKNYFLFSCGSFRIFYSTFTKRSDFKKNVAYLQNQKNI